MVGVRFEQKGFRRKRVIEKPSTAFITFNKTYKSSKQPIKTLT